MSFLHLYILGLLEVWQSRKCYKRKYFHLCELFFFPGKLSLPHSNHRDNQTNLSRKNNRSRAGPQTLSEERQQTVNPRYILRLFTLSRCHQRCSLDCDRMQMTRFSFYDHDATQSESAHHLALERLRLKLIDDIQSTCQQNT